MKKILFEKIKLLNFCGIRELEINFGEDLTIISGKNGLGKSTIANALTYVLFGTDLKGNALDIKTFDRDHNIIPEIEHSVELSLRCIEPDDIPGEHDDFTFKRTLTDSWKGDKCTNTYKYFINDEVCTASEFKKCVDSICPEVTFRLCSSATDFVSRPWAEQRKFLQMLVPEITADAITEGDAKYDFVLEALKKQDIETLVHHIKYKRSEIQKQLDEVPIRLQELNKTLPEAEDWEALASSLAEAKKQLDEVDAQVTTIKTGGADLVRNNAIREKLNFQLKRIEQMERGARKQSGEEEVKHGSDLITARTAQSKAQAMVDELQAKMDGFTDTELHIKQQLEDLERQKKDGAKLYDEASTEQWEWNDEDSFCPHCGQPLPPEKVLKMKRDSEDRFNERKANRLKNLVALAGNIKSDITKHQALLEQLNEDRTTTTNQLAEAHKALKEAEKHLAEVEAENPPSSSEILAANDNYKQANEEARRLKEELCKPVAEDEEQQKMLAELKEKSQSLNEKCSSLQLRYLNKEQYDKVTSLIEECKNNKETYQNQLDELDEKLDIATDYYQHSCSLLEDEVNKHFEFVRWSLFKTNLDGDKKPFCECYHDGVPYSRLNGAAKVNAGIDIAYTIAQFYDVSVPMILDECESNLHPIAKDGYQQIRLYVSRDEMLKIETPAKAVME